jgi:hypothetical protein
MLDFDEEGKAIRLSYIALLKLSTIAFASLIVACFAAG